MKPKKRKLSAMHNYRQSIPKGVTTTRYRPVMQKGVCVGTFVSYDLHGQTIEKQLPLR